MRYRKAQNGVALNVADSIYVLLFSLCEELVVVFSSYSTPCTIYCFILSFWEQ